MSRRIRVPALIAVLLSSAVSTRSAMAQSSNWKIDEVYSNSTANVQFVELTDTADGEFFVSGQTLTSGGQTFTFPTDLPNVGTTIGAHILLATPGYLALSGVAAPDYTLPAHFFNAVTDTLTYGGGLDSVTLDSFQLPLDNIHSLNRSPPDPTLVSAINSPTNFAGQAIQIPPWENQDKILDVDANGKIQPHDVALIINSLLDNGTHALPAPANGNVPPPYLDVNGDNFVKPNDANAVITFLLDNPQAMVVQHAALSALAPSAALGSPSIADAPEPGSIVLAMIAAVVLAATSARRHILAAGAIRNWIDRPANRSE